MSYSTSSQVRLSAPFFRSILTHAIAITIVPCTELNIGSWRREASSARHAFVGYFSEDKQCISWFIDDAETGCAVKMDIPFTSILTMHISSLSGGSEVVPLSAGVGDLAIATILLSHPPQFYMETFVETTTSQGMQLAEITKLWTACQDWTTGFEASIVLQHDVVGSAGPLRYLLENVIQPAVRAHTEGGVGYGNPLMSSVGQDEIRDFGLLPITMVENSEQSEVFPPPDLSSLLEEPYDDSYFLY